MRAERSVAELAPAELVPAELVQAELAPAELVPAELAPAELVPAEGCGRPMRADARRNYARLVEAARAAFAARGSEASIEEIARAADVGVGTLYRHFPRRIDLVEAVYREDVDGLVTLAGQVSERSAPWQALVAWLEGFLRYAQSKRTFLNELHEAFEKSPDLALTSRERISAAAGMVLERAQAAGAARLDLDAADLMQLVAGMCMARLATLEQNRRLLDVVLDGLRPPA